MCISLNFQMPDARVVVLAVLNWFTTLLPIVFTYLVRK